MTEPVEAALLASVEVPQADLHRLDSWLSALRYGRVLPGAYRDMSEDDQHELDNLCRLLRSWTTAGVQ